MQVIPTQVIASFFSQPKVQVAQGGLRASALQDNDDDTIADKVPTSRALGTNLNIRT